MTIKTTLYKFHQNSIVKILLIKVNASVLNIIIYYISYYYFSSVIFGYQLANDNTNCWYHVILYSVLTYVLYYNLKKVCQSDSLSHQKNCC